MSTQDTDAAEFQDTLLSLARGTRLNSSKAEEAFRGLVEAWGMPTTRVGPDADLGANISLVRERMLDGNYRDPQTETWAEREFGSRRPFVAGAARAVGETGDAVTREFDNMNERATIDANNPILETASPVEVDPQIVEVLRSRAPIRDRITTQAQAGFKARYNTINDRSDPLGMLSESEAVDLSGDTPSDFGIGSEEKDMKRFVDLVEISDFSQRAEETLNYMDLTATTMGQRMIEANLFMARQYYYGDPSVGSGNRDVEDGDAFEGMVKLASDASSSYVIDKSGTASGFLEDIKTELTTVVENTGLTYDAAAIAVSPTMFDELENEANAVVRLDSYDGEVRYGRRSIQIKGVEVFEDPNIRNYSSLTSTTTNGGDNGDVFIYDTRNLQYRELAPMSTVPLGKIGLADRAAMFEYGTLLSKSQGEHLRVLQAYDVGA
jgi:hypothetical protein